ncbi:MAG: hypothetical protein HWD62_09300 [Cyclobacteriaceae bacterium]|nr:MAG: hypothetical protein HWD62_09300 [Cyclobacteriaceae bacterium]
MAKGNLTSGIALPAIVGALALVGLVVYDVLFSKPHLMKGVIVDKLFVPGKNNAGPHALPYGKYRSYEYAIQAEQQEQWIAFVQGDDGKVLKVNCHSNHYEMKQVGNTLHLRKHTGELYCI